MEINYIGESLIYGQIGNFLIYLSLAAALLAALAYYFGTKENELAAGEGFSWRMLGRTSYIIHAVSTLGVIGIIYFLIYNHKFEYHYVWQHSSYTMPMKYIFASFWEGQEGSFLLWMFWHIVLSGFIIFRGGEWEKPVMSVLSVIQFFLASMLLGIVILGNKIGTNPFVLLRDHPDMVSMPFVQMPDYLQRIQDGRGLNPLLQNYWMTIHPPTLFLGFAATAIPFAFAIAGLLQGKLREWVKPAIPWAFFGVMILGTGILMGAAWAYEALSFGGFWAWDPVENASLVPWLTLVAAAHLMLIYKKKNNFLSITFILCIISFILVLYSTFLTRSGVLGDASVHSFTDLGMTGQLVAYMGFFVVLGGGLLIYNWKKIPRAEKEESLYSREFWMFIGTLVLIISAFQITFSTSTPVINKIFGTNMAPPVDAITHYNTWQIPIAIIISFLIAIGQFFKYSHTNMADFVKKIIPSFAIAILLSGFILWGIGQLQFIHFMLLFASTFAITANLDYFLRVIKGKVKIAGASVAHIGVALILLGSLISNSKKEIISQNVTNVDLGKEFPNNENILLRIGDTLRMGSYYITYTGRSQEGVNYFYNIEYFRFNPQTKTLSKAFDLAPVVQTNPMMGNVSEPATKRYLDKDIYTHVTYAALEDEEEEDEVYKKTYTKSVNIGDTISTSSYLIVLKGLETAMNREELNLTNDDIVVGATLQVIDINGNITTATPVYIIKDRVAYGKEEVLEEHGLKLGFNKIDPETGKIDITIAEKKSASREFIIMKAIVFPYINLLWAGCII
ncbi:MAG: cytochrome c biogenesis protein CcsA, partial [Bacteroidia bacterium]